MTLSPLLGIIIALGCGILWWELRRIHVLVNGSHTRLVNELAAAGREILSLRADVADLKAQLLKETSP